MLERERLAGAETDFRERDAYMVHGTFEPEATLRVFPPNWRLRVILARVLGGSIARLPLRLFQVVPVWRIRPLPR